MNDEQFFLANAYLDGELTAAERALAESDPAVMAEVEVLRALQAELRDVDPPSDAAREAAIAAAMSAFVTPSATHTGSTVVPIGRRRPYQRYLAVAAGVLGVGLLGVAIANLGTGSDDDSAADEPAAEEPAAEEPAAAPEARLTEESTMSAPADAASDDMAIAGAPVEEPAMEAAEEPAAEEPAAEEPAAEDGATRPQLVPGQVLTSPEELGSFGTGLLEQREAGTLPPTPETSCPIDNVLGRTEYLVGDEVTSLLVAVDEPAGIVLGFDDETCAYVVEGPVFGP